MEINERRAGKKENCPRCTGQASRGGRQGKQIIFLGVLVVNLL